MYKAQDNGPKKDELTRAHRTSGFERWLSVTTAPRGTYRTVDVVEMMCTHVEGRDTRGRFEVVIADDFTSHKSAVAAGSRSPKTAITPLRRVMKR